MKKILISLIIFIILFLCIKSGLGFGKKETIIDRLNNDNSTTNESLLDSYYTSTKPVEINYKIFNEKISNSYMVLLNKDSNIKNENFKKLKEDFDFNNNTYVLINISNMKVSQIILDKEKLKKDNINLNVSINNKENINQSIIIEIKNIKINNISYIHLNYINS